MPTLRVTAVLVSALAVLPAAACSNARDTAPIDAHADAGGADSGTGAPNGSDAKFDQLVAWAQRDLEQAHVPGAAIAIVIDGKLAFARGVGVKRAGGTDAVTERTLFDINSMTKALVAAAVMQDVDQGKVNVTHPIADYVPTFKLAQPFDPRSITVRQVLSHTAGMPDDDEEKCEMGPDGLAHWWDRHTTYPLWAPPGAVWNYSNVDYSLLGLLIEKISGRAFADELTARVLRPAGMVTATLDPAVAKAADHAVGHSLAMDGTATSYYDPENVVACAMVLPAGGVYASVVDFAHFAEVMLARGKGLMTEASAIAMQSAQADTRTPLASYGYGLFAYEQNGQQVIGHGGGGPGFLSDWLIVPARNFGVVVFANTDTYEPFHIVAHAMNLFLDLPEGAPPQATTPPSAWDGYVGAYDDPFTFGNVTVRVDGGKLVADFKGFPATPMRQLANDYWLADFAAQGTLGFVFWRAAPQSNAKYMVSRAGIPTRTCAGCATPHRGAADGLARASRRHPSFHVPDQERSRASQ